jgi:hypothetical protein
MPSDALMIPLYIAYLNVAHLPPVLIMEAIYQLNRLLDFLLSRRPAIKDGAVRTCANHVLIKKSVCRASVQCNCCSPGAEIPDNAGIASTVERSLLEVRKPMRPEHPEVYGKSRAKGCATARCMPLTCF